MGQSDMQWYCRNNPEEKRYYEILFMMCRKYQISWSSASEKEKFFIEEVTRVTYERERAERLGLPHSSIRLAFSP